MIQKNALSKRKFARSPLNSEIRTSSKAKKNDSMLSCKGVMGKNKAPGSLLARTPDKGKKKIRVNLSNP
jgi:hypothetical protein